MAPVCVWFLFYTRTPTWILHWKPMLNVSNTDSPTPPTAINGRYVSHLTAWKRLFSMKDIKRFWSCDTIFIKMYDCYIDIFFLIGYLSKICWKTYRLSAFANTGLYHVTALFTPEFKTRQYGGGTVLVCIPFPSQTLLFSFDKTSDKTCGSDFLNFNLLSIHCCCFCNPLRHLKCKWRHVIVTQRTNSPTVANAPDLGTKFGEHQNRI